MNLYILCGDFKYLGGNISNLESRILGEYIWNIQSGY